MKVVLKQDVKSIGKKDELHEVSDGYARNYLLPRGLAVAADAAAVNEVRTKAAASEHTAGAGGLAHWKRMASRPWLWFGICCYVLEFFVWMAFLSQVELSVGVMLGSFNIVVIMLAGRLFFKEKLTRWRVTGISLITLGVAIVGVGG